MLPAHADLEVSTTSASPGDAEAGEPVAKPRSRITPFLLTKVFGALQAAALVVGMAVSAYTLLAVPPARRDSFNLDDVQLRSYLSLGNAALLTLLADMYVWYARIRAVVASTTKHKEEQNIPYGAQPVELGSQGLTLASWYITAVLAGSSLPLASMMLASDTPAHHTLRLAWVMSACSALALAAAALRHMAPYIAPGTLFDAILGTQERPTMLAAAPLLVMMAADAVVAGMALAAAMRPRAFIVVEAAPAQEAGSVSWLQASVLARVPANPSADVERDAMGVVAALALAALALWGARTVHLSMTGRSEKQTTMHAGAAVAASAAQAMLLGTIIPGVGIITPGAIQQYAAGVARSQRGVHVSWVGDPLCGLIACAVVVACVAHLGTRWMNT